MKKKVPIYFLFLVSFLCSCSGAETKTYQKFTAKKPQAVSQRTVRNLTPVDSLNITKTFNGYSIRGISLSESSIIAKLGHQKIVRLNKQDLSTIAIFTIPKGKGPGEVLHLNTVMLQAGKDFIALYSLEEKKTDLYDLNGNFQKEFLNGGYHPHGTMAMANEQTYYFEVGPPASKYLFYEVKRTAKDRSTVVRRFPHLSNNKNPLAYTGRIAVHNQSLYYAGYSEPLIKRYKLSGKNVKLVWSRAVIDAYNSKNNYQKPRHVSGSVTGRYWSYTQDAQFASNDIAVDDDFLYSVRANNNKAGYKYLDVYSVKDGNYIGSFHLRYYPYEIAVDKHDIYIIEVQGDKVIGVKGSGPVTVYLMKYKKPDMDF